MSERERDRDKEREIDRDKERQRDRETEREKETDTIETIQLNAELNPMLSPAFVSLYLPLHTAYVLYSRGPQPWGRDLVPGRIIIVSV